MDDPMPFFRSGHTLVEILRVMLGAGMLACVGYFCCCIADSTVLILFLLFLCVLLLISPSIVDEEQASFLTYAGLKCEAQQVNSGNSAQCLFSPGVKHHRSFALLWTLHDTPRLGIECVRWLSNTKCSSQLTKNGVLAQTGGFA